MPRWRPNDWRPNDRKHRGPVAMVNEPEKRSELPPREPTAAEVAAYLRGHDRAWPDNLAVAAGRAQAQHERGTLEPEGLDQRACLSRAFADRDRHAPHRVPARLERPHAGLGPDDAGDRFGPVWGRRSEEHTSELQSLMRI